MKTMVGKWLGKRAPGTGGAAAAAAETPAGALPAAEGPAVEGPAAGASGADAGRAPIQMPVAEFGLGDVVRHRVFPFRGVIFDVDPEFANTEEWWEAIPAEVRPRKDQPFYHLLAENDDSAYVAYVSQQNLLPDDSGVPVGHPAVAEMFDVTADGEYVLKGGAAN